MGNGLRTARERAGLTRTRLGELVGRHSATVGRWETGARNPLPAERCRLAEILDADVDSLFSAFEPSFLQAARCVVAARSVSDLQRAVTRLGVELETLDAVPAGTVA